MADTGIKKTKERVLRAACEIFAEKGFSDTTVADICEAAGANIASVNYYFGDKETLYDEVWRHAFAITASTYPVDEGVSEHADIETLLFSYARAVLQRVFSDGEAGLFPRLLNQEMAAPTLALDRIAKDALLPQSRQVMKAVKLMFGEDCDETLLRHCKFSIIGQCAFYNFSRPLRERVTGLKRMGSEEIDSIAHHIAQFSLGGMKQIKAEAGSTPSSRG
jgi:AcrR family transcriptional regulator